MTNETLSLQGLSVLCATLCVAIISSLTRTPFRIIHEITLVANTNYSGWLKQDEVTLGQRGCGTDH